MVSEDTSTHGNDPAEGSPREATEAPAKSRRNPASRTLALTAVVALAVGAGVGYVLAHSAPGEAPTIAGVNKKTVCKLVSESMQEQLSIREASPMAEEKGGASCYLMMTQDDAAEPAGFVVAFYPTTVSLQQTVDGTDVIPEKAEPLLIEGRPAARQILYGDAWKAQLTVDAGDGAMLYVERFGPKDSLSERELRRSVDDLAASVLKGQNA